jgi:CBS domain-containing protein
MRQGVATVRPDTTGEDVARAVLGSGVGRVAVVDATGHLAGVIATRDLLPLASDASRHHFVGALGGVAGRLEAFLFGLGSSTEAQPTAGELMRREVTAVAGDASLGEVLRLMMAKGLKRILVTDPRGIPVGVIDRADVVRALAPGLGRTGLAGSDPGTPHQPGSSSGRST